MRFRNLILAALLLAVALAPARAFAEQAKSDLTARLDHAAELIDDGSWDQAISILESVLEAEPTNPRALKLYLRANKAKHAAEKRAANVRREVENDRAMKEVDEASRIPEKEITHEPPLKYPKRPKSTISQEMKALLSQPVTLNLADTDLSFVLGLLRDMVRHGCEACVMECSSHALDQGRVDSAMFNVAVFTNLTGDHLDYHGTMDAYGAAKARLFDFPCLRCRVVNIDDGFGRELAGREHESRLITYSLEDPSVYLFCAEARLDDDGIHARLITPQGERSLRSPLLGRFNVSNVLAAVGALLGMDYPLDEILNVLPELEGPTGRMQRLGGGDHPLVVVDYAHTPDALEKVLTALRPHARGRLLCLFGCGGDRDSGKRPLMAEVAERLADGIVVTDDNPRNEAPERILDDIRSGFVNPDTVTFVHGRAQAIASLIAAANADDVVVLAG